MTPTSFRLPAIVLSAGVLAGCASSGGVSHPNDPFEGMNRGIYSFNTVVDENVMQPVARGYQAVVPTPVRSCVSNVFSNLHDVWSSVNLFLQGRAPQGINMFGRVLMNSTLGGLGCFDVATPSGVPRERTDFGVTLGVWGFDSGPYLVLPFFGPSSIRDGIGLGADAYAGILGQVDNVRLRNTLWPIEKIDARARALNATDLVGEVALDPYLFVRDAYLQYRANLVRGDFDAGVPNYEDDDDDFEDSTPLPPAINTGP